MEGHKTSGNRLPIIFLDANCISVDVSRTGVDGLGGEGGVEGRFLSAEIALFGTNWEDVVTVLVIVGEGHRLEPEGVDGVGDLYLELTSLVRDRWVVPLFLSAGSNGGLGISTAECFCNASSDSCTSIHTLKIRPH